jgi:hypothetical protein
LLLLLFSFTWLFDEELFQLQENLLIVHLNLFYSK